MHTHINVIIHRYEEIEPTEQKMDANMENMMSNNKNDFSKDPVWKCIITQAVPLTIAQLVQLLYNVVDRIYIGHLGDGNSLALNGYRINISNSKFDYGFRWLVRNGWRTSFFYGTRCWK